MRQNDLFHQRCRVGKKLDMVSIRYFFQGNNEDRASEIDRFFQSDESELISNRIGCGIILGWFLAQATILTQKYRKN